MKSILVAISISFAVLTCMALNSCDQNVITGCPGNYHFESHNLFTFVIEDQTGNNILHIGQLDYNYDTVKIYDENWTDVYPYGEWEAWDGIIHFKFIDKELDEGVLNHRISRQYYMYFNYQDIDTIQIEFEMKKNRCDEQSMSYFKVAYNDSIYFDNSVEEVPGLNFIKRK